MPGFVLFFFSTVLDFSEQDGAIQLLLFMLPPCNSDTLQRLLDLLSTVSAHAEDSLDSEGRKVKKLVCRDTFFFIAV